MKKFDHIYTNGCSFTGDWYRRDRGEVVYGDLVARHYNATLQNAGKPNSCNRRIIRSTVRDAIDFPPNTLALIQLTFLHRTEQYSAVNDSNSWKFDREDYHESIKPQEGGEFMTAFVNQFDARAEFTALSSDVLMLASYFKQQGISYLIYAFPLLVEDVQQRQELAATSLCYELRKDPAVMDLLNDSLFAKLTPGDYFYDANGLAGEIGHPNTAGHKLITKILTQLIDSTYQSY
jgi:hypothetical protein